MLRKRILPIFLLLASCLPVFSQSTHSVAREWIEATLQAIREDRARPPVHARNLFHVSMAMYDAWAAYDTSAQTYLLGKTVGGYTCVFNGIPAPADIQSARETAISYAAHRLLTHRFAGSFNAPITLEHLDVVLMQLGFDPAFTSTDYSTGNPAALGNYIAQQVIAYGLQDGANEINDYTNLFYQPVNPPMIVQFPGNPDIEDPNRWQPLSLNVFIDQNGNILGNTPPFQSPEWGLVTPFAMTAEDRTEYERDGHPYWVYHDPGPPPQWEPTGAMSEVYKWNFSLVSTWSAHLASADTTMWDISPRGIGNNQSYPHTFEEYRQFYDIFEGGDSSPGHDINPHTGQPYEPQWVKRGDYARVLAEFWADGPSSETPPGHWYSILNYVNDNPALVKKFNGKGPVLDDLEWDIKAYFTLGGAVHDAAISAWGIKGWYDYVRPISAIRFMAGLGQSSDPGMPSYNPGGIPLYPGFIELIQTGDPLAGFFDENVGKIKLMAWRGPNYIFDPYSEEAGVDWILAEEWMPYQRPTFVTPPFAGFISGHSTYSRAAAEALTLVTGDAFFPGGMGVFEAPANEYLVFEDGPSQNITLQWATYRDASDQCSLSRIWGGIHPPCDDIPGRLIGAEAGTDAFELARAYFYRDNDNDGYFSYEDCDDGNPEIRPGAAEICDGIDNDCNGFVDEGLAVYTYYRDADADGYGDLFSPFDTCLTTPPPGYVANHDDCNDLINAINPDAEEICDGIDNDCNESIDDGIPYYTYYRDADVDGFGNAADSLVVCQGNPPSGYVTNKADCNDNAGSIRPSAEDIPDNGIDEDCSGSDLFTLTKLFPNPVRDELTIHYVHEGLKDLLIYNASGQFAGARQMNFVANSATISLVDLAPGVYILRITESDGDAVVWKIVKL